MGTQEDRQLFTPRPFNAAQPVVRTDLKAESDGGVVCELRRVWTELNIISSSIEKDWPNSNAKLDRLARNQWAMDVISEAGKRLKAHLATRPSGWRSTSGLPEETSEEGF